MENIFTILIPIIALATIVIIAKRISLHTFKCNHCLNQFNIKWYKVIISEHSGNEYKLVCPYCKTKSWCSEQFKK